MIVKGYIGL